MEGVTSEIEERKKKVTELKRSGFDPYGKKYEKTHYIKELADKFHDLKNGEKKEKFKVSLAGRIRSIRKHGKIAFCDLQDTSGRIQIFIETKTIGERKFKFFD